ncbi:MAG TPA: glycosyltransferase [Saprospiraceae bacterium]|nr:glycosyltransferase [Saprospiraceae bacterium]
MDARGAFSVMDSFLKEMNHHYNDFRDNGIKMLFLAGNEKLCRHKNDLLEIEFNPFPKKSWFHKWKYERIILPELFIKGNFDVYLSMQNYVLKNINKKQFVLMHQPIPFSDLKWKDLELLNWFKYNIIFKILLKRQRQLVSGAIVQTAWMKQALIDKFEYNCPVKIIRPAVNNIMNNTKPLPGELLDLFKVNSIKLIYPTNLEKYKNNQRLINAINGYNNSTNKKIVLYLTIPGKSTEYVKYINKIQYESIMTLYTNMDAMIFPSLTETLGLPLLEAQYAEIPILAADLPYAREVCGNECIYFNPRSTLSIINALNVYVENTKVFKYKSNTIKGSYYDYIKFISDTVITR